ncbi:MAG: flagellar hook-associated protein FlgL [Desulfobulbaceae bacterium]|jgi:flagellar hook-associated protein 3 FlgL|nr:flagellar hook-associated protein FlgL [Desulfobulbaceae bacterium]
MRVTENSSYRLLQTNLQRINKRLNTLYNQGASGSKFNVASDDPTAIRPVLTTRTQLRHTDRYLETMGVTADKMESTDGHLNSVENVLQRAKELGLKAINSGLSSDDLNSIADEIAEMRSELLDSANATIDGKYVFSGYQENTKPFSANPNYDPATYDETDSTTWPYTYNGDANPAKLEISPGEYIDTTLTGNELFMGISNANWVDGATAASGQPEANHVDIFSVMTRLEEAVRAGNFTDETGPGGGVQKQTANLEVAANQERRLRSQMGVRAARVESSMEHQEDVKNDLKQLLSRYQDTDAIENFNAIVQQESALQAALNITARVSEISILDYL